MAVTLTVKFDDVAPAAAMARLEVGSRDLSVLMGNIGSTLINGAQERIGQTNVSPEGVPWQPSKRASKTGGKTLYESGQLMNGLNAEAAPQQVVVGSVEPYAGAHQAGMEIEIPARRGKIHRLQDADGRVENRFVKQAIANLTTEVDVPAYTVTLPARPYLGISDEEQAQIEEHAVAFFNGLLGGGGA